MARLVVQPEAIEEAAKLLYIRALKVLPEDIKQGFQRLARGRRIQPGLPGLRCEHHGHPVVDRR